MPDAPTTPVSPLAAPGGRQPVTRRRFGDIPALRTAIYDSVLGAAQNLEPLKNVRYTLSLHNPHYEGPDEHPISKQKEVLLSGGTLARRLAGTWRLTDNATGKVADEKTMTLARVPHLTQRGTFIFNGSDYVLSHQSRLRPGIYVRRQANEQVEAHAAVAGRGASHRYFFEPETQLFKVRVGQAEVPAIPLLRALGATDKELREAWGREVFAKNQPLDSDHHLQRLYDRMVRKPPAGAEDTPGTRREHLAAAVRDMRLDPDVMRSTLGKPHEHIDKDVLLAVTRKLLDVNRGRAEPDDREHLAYQQVLGPEDLLAERVTRDRQTLQKALWQATFHGHLGKMPPGVFNRSITNVLQTSGLGSSPEGVSAAEFVDHGSRITRMGEGGLSSEAIPAEATAVHPSQLGFIDLVKAPEAETAGVDSRVAFGVQKGSDGRLYAPFRDIHTGSIVYKSPQDVSNLVVAFPGELAQNKPYVAALDRGRATYVPRHRASLELPSMEQSFSPLSNLVPMKSAMKAQRASMGARMAAQALPLENAEAPLVRSGVPGQPGRSFEELYGRHAGAVMADRGGRIEKVTPQSVVVRHDDGERKEYELYNNQPSNRKTYLHNDPLVKPGELVTPGQVLAQSNFTDRRGHLAYGLNARIAYVPALGKIYEDSGLISQSFADRMRSQHSYQHRQDWDDSHRRGKKAFVALFPGKYPRKMLENFDDEGIIKPGTPVSYGDPLVLVAQERERDHAQVGKSSKMNFADKSLTWDHHDAGVVTDVVNGRDGVNVVVKSTQPMKTGDKLCFDKSTEVLTRRGWRPIADIDLDDEVCSLVDGLVVYQRPTAIHSYPTGGWMYRIKSQQVDLFVTAEHRMYVKTRGSSSFDLIPAGDLYGRRVNYKKNGVWVGEEPGVVELAGALTRVGQGGKTLSTMPDLTLRPETYLMLLGAYLSEGSLIDHPASGTYGIDLHQIKPSGRDELRKALEAAGVKYCETPNRFRIYSKTLMNYFRQFGYCHEKYIPDEVFAFSPRLLRVLFHWLMWGDGHTRKLPISYTTTSKRLADDMMRLCLHIGIAANVKARDQNHRNSYINGHEVRGVLPIYDVRIINTKLTPQVNHGHTRSQGTQQEYFVENYREPVYCVTVPGHVIYVRRNGLTVWSGNSSRYGSKSVVHVVPDHQMPHDESGRPFDMAWSPLQIVSRINPALWIEGALGRVAAKTGQPYVLHDWDSRRNLTQFALDELKKHGLPEQETVTDPTTGRKIPGVTTGMNFIMKLHHQAEGKSSGRGLGSYDPSGAPQKGGGGGALRLSLGDSQAILAHGSVPLLRDAHVTRGARNDDLWAAYTAGYPLPQPKVPLQYEKFLQQLTASGIRVRRDGPRLHLMALTSKDIDTLAGDRTIRNGDLVEWGEGLKPIAGGLFDPKATGGHGSSSWSKIPLHEPMLNPAFEDPARRLLGLTEKKFRDVLAGREEMGGRTGPAAVEHALKAIDVPAEIETARKAIDSGRKGARDEASRRLRYLKAAEKTGVHPGDWVWHAVPVLPTMFRPVSMMAGGRGQLINDANPLYREVIEANDNLSTLKGKVADVGAERLAVYDAMKAVAGLGGPTHPKNVERGVKGVLETVLGSSAKYSALQQKLLGTTVDLAGRAVVVPDPDMDMDHVGLPESKAWEVFQPFVVRRLVRRGVPRVEAVRAVRDQTKQAKDALIEEMGERPVVVNRYPVLHRYNDMAFFPKLVSDDTIHFPPLATSGMNMDFDGDASQFHVPVSDDAVQDTIEKMLPSKNLFKASTFRVHQAPGMEYLQGLHAASTARQDGRARLFRSRADALAAYRRGELALGTPVEIVGG
jgi:DNA-directed RNA polymerase beta subunit